MRYLAENDNNRYGMRASSVAMEIRSVYRADGTVDSHIDIYDLDREEAEKLALELGQKYGYEKKE